MYYSYLGGSQLNPKIPNLFMDNIHVILRLQIKYDLKFTDNLKKSFILSIFRYFNWKLLSKTQGFLGCMGNPEHFKRVK